MSEVRYFGVTNLDKHQHYKDRRPPWVKLHRTVFNDYAFSRLQGASKAHLMLLWLLASEYDNRMPYDPEWVGRKIDAQEPVDLDALVSAGFLTLYQDASDALADCPESARPEDREQSTETVSQSVGVVAEVRALLPTDMDRHNYDTLLASSGAPETVAAECRASLDGMHGRALTPSHLARAIGDFRANNGGSAFNLAHFRGYLRRSTAPVRPPPGVGVGGAPRPTGGVGARTYANAVRALEDE